MNDKKVK